MEKISPPEDEAASAAADLARRLKRLRGRMLAEGRPRSVRLIDQAIDEARKGAGGE